MKTNTIYNNSWQDLLPTIPNSMIDLIIIDPPYVVTKETWDLQETVSDNLAQELLRVLKESGSLYIWCGIGEKSQSLIRWFPIFNNCFHFKDLITWKKQRGIGMRKGWLYTREECMWFVKNNKQFIWNKQHQYGTECYNPAWAKRLGKEQDPRKRATNVWTDIKEESLSGLCGKLNIDKKSFNHYTPKPELLIERIVLSHTNENDIVLDCFSGSGTTGAVCQQFNRKFILGDINNHFCQIASKRLNCKIKQLLNKKPRIIDEFKT